VADGRSALPSFPVACAAAASAAAGLVHATAAGTHAGNRQLVVLFALTAVAQLAWAGVTAFRPSRVVLILGAALNGAAALAWVLSRTIGLSAIESLAEPEPVGFQDLTAAVLGAVAAAAAVVALVRSERSGWASRPTAPVPAFLAGAAVLALAIPAMAVEHTHGPSHEHGHAHPGTETATAGDDHAHPATDDHHDETANADAPSGPIISVDDPRVTAAQRDAAQTLIDTTRTAMAAFSDPASVEAAGYRSIGDEATGFEHFVNYGFLADPEVLDPAKVESIVFEVKPDGTKQLASAMYILPPGQAMADVPDIAGELTTWHDHQNLCWEGGRVVGLLVNGQCTAGTFLPTPPMLHVWVTEHPCGPFAGLETHGGVCEHAHAAGEEQAAGD
jgi:hypothetical protein